MTVDYYVGLTLAVLAVLWLIVGILNRVLRRSTDDT